MTGSWRFDDVAWDTLDPLDQLVYLSRYYGSDPEFVLAGGGNTSVKVGDTLYVKASGHALATIDRRGFAALSRRGVLAILEKTYSPDPVQREDQVKRDLLATRLDPTGPRPSVEAILHALIDARFVVHTHPATVNAVICAVNGRRTIERLFGREALWVPYVSPGYTLARRLAGDLAAYRAHFGRSPRILFFANHGFCVAVDEVREARRLTDRVFRTLVRAGASRRWPRLLARGRPARPDDQRPLVNLVAPMLRGLLAEPDRRPIVRFDDSPGTQVLVRTAMGRRLAFTGPVYPDQITYCLSLPLWVPALEGRSPKAVAVRLQKALAAYRRRHGLSPTVILVQGLGMFTVGASAAAAEDVAAVYLDAARVMVEAAGFGGPRPLTRAQRRFIEEWEVEAFRRQVAAGAASGRVAGRVAVVTGGAQGLGEAIVSDLTVQGAHVVVADLNHAGAQAVSERLNTAHGRGRTLALPVNVADESSVADLVHQTVRAFGGVDVLVSNAGVLKAGSVKTLAQRDFQFVADVNYTGYFLCTKHVAPIMAWQHRVNRLLTCDIIQINSKSGLEGSNRNAAYAGSKFGGIGLTQSFALELVEDGIKVNSICPGNYLDGPLWSDPKKGLFVQYLRAGKVPGARTVADVRAAYEAKVPMGRGLQIPDLMRAIYYVIEQQYETGQALPVTGGQVMLK